MFLQSLGAARSDGGGVYSVTYHNVFLHDIILIFESKYRIDFAR